MIHFIRFYFKNSTDDMTKNSKMCERYKIILQ